MTAVNLVDVWLELEGKLAAADISVNLPRYLGWAKGWPLDKVGGWYQETGRLYVSEQIAHVPLLVRDVLIHEITHQIQYAMAADSDPHGDLYLSCGTRVASILGCPSPTRHLVVGWPHEQRSAGFFGPYVTRNERHNANGADRFLG